MLNQSDRSLSALYDIIVPNSEKIIWECSSHGRLMQISGAEARRQITELSKRICKATGQSGRYIGLYGDSSTKWLLGFWSILKSGNYPFLMNRLQPQSMLGEALRLLKIDTVVSTVPTQFAKQNLFIDELLCTPCCDVFDLPFADTFALTTSGTSLEVKICVYHGRQICALLDNTEEAIGRNRAIAETFFGEMKSLALLPFYHIFGLEGSYFWLSFLGAVQVFTDARSVEAILQVMRERRVTHLFSVPMFWNAVAAFAERLGCRSQSEFRYHTFGPSFIFGIAGGASMKADVLKRFNDNGYILCCGYGMTELGIVSVDFSKDKAKRRIPSIGKPFPSAQFSIADGQLYVDARTACETMITSDGTLTPNVPFATGDLVDAAYNIVGRVSELVHTASGEKLNPVLAERAFMLPDAEEFIVYGDDRLGGLGLLCRVKNRESLPALRAEIDTCNAALPLSYRMKTVLFTQDPLAENAGIKPSRKAVAAKLAAGLIHTWNGSEDPLETSANENTAMRKKLREIFAQCLDCAVSDVDDRAHFLNELGGDSLSYYEMVGMVCREFDVQIPYDGPNSSYSVLDFERVITCLSQKF